MIFRRVKILISLAFLATLVGAGFVVFAPAKADLSANVIANGDVELVTNGYPQGFNIERPTTHYFIYPDPGYKSARAVSVHMDQLSETYAGWFFDPIPVTGNDVFIYSAMYKSVALTFIIARYALADGDFHDVKLAEVPPSDKWKKVQAAFIVPKKAVAVTVMQVLVEKGKLTTDDHALVKTEFLTKMPK